MTENNNRLEKVRADIEAMIRGHLLGPLEKEELIEAPPADVYLTGILWPRDTGFDQSEDDAGTSENASDDSDSIDASVPGYRAIRPCSIGITFDVLANAEVILSLGSTARYKPVYGEEHSDSETESRRPKRWQRSELGYRVRISADDTRETWRTSNFEKCDGTQVRDPDIAVDIRRRFSDGTRIITATLINLCSDDVPNSVRDSQLFFQCQLVASSTDSSDRPAIVPRQAYPFADDDEDQLTNLLIYRAVREFAVGHGVAATWSTGNTESVDTVSTSWLPRMHVAGTSPDGHKMLQDLKSGPSSPFSAETLGTENQRTSVCDSLGVFCDIYGEWIGSTLTDHVEDFGGDLGRAAAQNESRCRDTLRRLRAGVDVLRESDIAWKAFTLANTAMNRQSWFVARGERRGPLTWRPFQLAFVLLVIPGLVDPKDDDRDTMDLLWFPTGGGKTEAYLALTAFEIFRQRISNAQRREAGGTDVLMRYTLRLLTIQQFQRATALIAACELLRRENADLLGAATVSIGLYVGGGSTPNYLSQASEVLMDEAEGRRPPSTPRQLLECPVCGHELATSAYRIDLDCKAMSVTCRAEDCEFGGAPQAVLTVDEAIYACPPSLLIGTVDKFAQLPRNENLGVLFGPDPSDRLGLIIQDELHLISGPLGSMTGLYESAIDLLCTSDLARAKVIGSTATIGRARKQVRALFDRDVLQFPAPGFDATDSFFAVGDDAGPGRLYVGLSTAGRSPKFALQALLAALMQSAYEMLAAGAATEEELDPYWTCVAYFNSLRELGGAHVLLQDDVRRQIVFLAGRSGADPRPMEEPPLELSSRVPSRDIPEVLQQLNQTLSDDDVYAAPPPDAVLASNMISVGVDVPRLGMMAVTGQPKSTAEYIQSTSRVGRGLPGLIVTLYNFGRPRDLSHFEHFVTYHSALYRGVEATSVTPWAPRARDKALHAVLASAVRHLVPGMRGDDSAIAFDPSHPKVGYICSYLLKRASDTSEGLEGTGTSEDLDEITTSWKHRASDSRSAGKRFIYWERRNRFGRSSPHLMRSAEQLPSPGSTGRPTPNSLREVEPSTALVLRKIHSRNQDGD